jgi:transposase, IS30 family
VTPITNQKGPRMSSLSLLPAARQYSHLSSGERHQIHALRSVGLSIRGIATQLGRSPSTISTELARCRNGYDPDQAQDHAKQSRAPAAGRDWVLGSPAGQLLVVELLDAMKVWRRSVTQALKDIAGGKGTAALLAQVTRPSVVYRWITRFGTTVQAARELNRAMIRPHHRRFGKHLPRKPSIPNMVSVLLRPQAAADRSEPGHWEGDLMFGKGQDTHWITVVDRNTRVTRILCPANKTSNEVIAKLVEWATTSGDIIKTLTWDRGSELWYHQDFTEATGVPVFFCDAHSPWQRPTNENTNGVLRRFCPKGTDLDTDPRQVQFYEDCLNTRPMAVLSWATPEQVLTQFLQTG